MIQKSFVHWQKNVLFSYFSMFTWWSSGEQSKKRRLKKILAAAKDERRPSQLCCYNTKCAFVRLAFGGYLFNRGRLRNSWKWEVTFAHLFCVMKHYIHKGKSPPTVTLLWLWKMLKSIKQVHSKSEISMKAEVVVAVKRNNSAPFWSVLGPNSQTPEWKRL